MDLICEDCWVCILQIDRHLTSGIANKWCAQIWLFEERWEHQSRKSDTMPAVAIMCSWQTQRSPVAPLFPGCNWVLMEAWPSLCESCYQQAVAGKRGCVLGAWLSIIYEGLLSFSVLFDAQYQGAHWAEYTHPHPQTLARFCLTLSVSPL